MPKQDIYLGDADVYIDLADSPSSKLDLESSDSPMDPALSSEKITQLPFSDEQGSEKGPVQSPSSIEGRKEDLESAQREHMYYLMQTPHVYSSEYLEQHHWEKTLESSEEFARQMMYDSVAQDPDPNLTPKTRQMRLREWWNGWLSRHFVGCKDSTQNVLKIDPTAVPAPSDIRLEYYNAAEDLDAMGMRLRPSQASTSFPAIPEQYGAHGVSGKTNRLDFVNGGLGSSFAGMTENTNKTHDGMMVTLHAHAQAFVLSEKGESKLDSQSTGTDT